MSTAEPNAMKRATANCTPLTKYIACYKNVTFTTNVLNKTFEHGLEVKFVAFNQTFDLVLASVYKPTVISHQLNVKLVGADGSVRHSYTFNDYFSGYVRGEPSHFSGRYVEGILDGILEMDEETYYLEPMDRYFQSMGNNFGRYRLVAYRETDISVSAQLNVQWKQTHQSTSPVQNAGSRTIHVTPPNYEEIKGTFKHLPRQKRGFATPYKVCELKIIIDYNFFNIYCNKSVKRAVDEAAYAVSLSDRLFRNIDFDSNGISDNVGFAINDVMIFENNTSPDYYLGHGNVANAVLRAFSRYNFSRYCLGVLLTYRDFDENIIGLAWPASSTKHGRPGGICQRRIFSFGKFRSFNSLLVTPLTRGTVLPRHVLASTMAHELGHSFGSHHDDSLDKLCGMEGKYGAYLMSVIASTYLKPNNNKFSPCSLLSMGPVVAHKANCLKVYDEHSLCGNYLIDPGEECDCGPTVETCHKFDPCCVAPSRGKPGCRVLRELDKHCSPRMSPCCTQDCKVEPNPVLCRASTECSHESRCGTASAECPDPAPLADGTLCRDGTHVCLRGKCDGSRCTHHGWEDCQCRTTEEELCELCCKPTNATQTWCLPAYKLASDDDIMGPIYKHERELCNNNMGYCNKQHRCNVIRPIDYDDVFSLIFQLSAKEQLAEWGNNYWYFVVIGVVSLTCILNFLRAFYNRKVPLTALAISSAKMTALWEMINYQYEQLEKQLQRLHVSYEMKLVHLEQGGPMDMVVGVSRMRKLFPTTPQHFVVEAVSNSGCEEFAVRLLLVRGYPLKRQVGVYEEIPHETCSKEVTTLDSYADEVTPMTPVEATPSDSLNRP